MDIFELNSARINEILYFMENQDKDSYANMETGKIELYDKGLTPEDDNLFPIPEWGPTQGFRVMDEFVADMKNPILRQELRGVLKSGHGVFRKFKNVLKGYPDIQKLWYAFKKREMKALILSWYNQIREIAGLEILSDDDIEDESDLLVFDFNIQKAKSKDFDFIIEQDKIAFYESNSSYPIDVIGELYERKRDGINREDMAEDLLYVVKTPTGENAGFVWCLEYILGNSFKVLEVLQVYVLPAFRGLGIGKMLIETIVTDYRKLKGKELIINVNGNSWILKQLENLGLKIETQELYLRG